MHCAHTDRDRDMGADASVRGSTERRARTMHAPCVYWDQKEKDEAPPPKTTKTSLGARQNEKERRAGAKDIVLDLSKEEWWYLVANGALFGYQYLRLILGGSCLKMLIPILCAARAP